MDIYEVSSIYQWTTVIWFTSNTLPDFQLNIASTGSYYLYFFNKSHLSMSKGLKKKVQIHKGKNSSQGDDSGSQILTNSRKMESRWRRGNWLSIKNRAELQMTMEGNTTEKYAHRHPGALEGLSARSRSPAEAGLRNTLKTRGWLSTCHAAMWLTLDHHLVMPLWGKRGHQAPDQTQNSFTVRREPPLFRVQWGTWSIEPQTLTLYHSFENIADKAWSTPTTTLKNSCLETLNGPRKETCEYCHLGHSPNKVCRCPSNHPKARSDWTLTRLLYKTCSFLLSVLSASF